MYVCVCLYRRVAPAKTHGGRRSHISFNMRAAQVFATSDLSIAARASEVAAATLTPPRRCRWSLNVALGV